MCEYCSGGTLRDFMIKQKRCAESFALLIMKNLLLGYKVLY
jgi:hypothetical protein